MGIKCHIHILTSNILVPRTWWTQQTSLKNIPNQPYLPPVFGLLKFPSYLILGPSSLKYTILCVLPEMHAVVVPVRMRSKWHTPPVCPVKSWVGIVKPGQPRCLAYTRRLTNVGSMLVRRRRRRANIEPALGKRPVFARWWQRVGMTLAGGWLKIWRVGSTWDRGFANCFCSNHWTIWAANTII